MPLRLATVCLLALTLALPWPVLAHAATTGATADAAGSAAMVDAATGEAAADDAGSRSGHTGCHGGTTVDGEAGSTSAGRTSDTTTGSGGHECCSGGCDCGCLTTASPVATAPSANDAAPMPIAGFVAKIRHPVAGARLLRPPIHG